MTLSRRLFCAVGSRRWADPCWIAALPLMISVPVATAGGGAGDTPSAAAGGLQLVSVSDLQRRERWGTVPMPLAPEEIAMQHWLASQVGPAVGSEHEILGMNQFEQAVFCGICDFDATTSLESALPASWNEYGDAFLDRPDAVAGRWLRDQGCFIIIACSGAVNPANRLRLPAAFDYTAALPAFKVCGFISNFNARNDAANTLLSLLDYPPDPSGNTFTPVNQQICANLAVNPPPVANNQRDQDVLLFRVPAGGINGFRMFVTVGQEFIASLGVNKNFPNPGDINSCYTNPINPGGPTSEYGHIALIGGERGITNPDSTTGDGYEGAINSTWAFPRQQSTFLPEGTYLITVRLKGFGSLVPPSTPTPPGTRYQIQVIGTFAGETALGACCTVGNNACVDAQLPSQCGTLGGVWRGAGTTCAAVNAGDVPCDVGLCTSTPEGSGRDCNAGTDLNRGCAAAPTGGLDPIAPGQTICGFSGGAPTLSIDADEDWFTYESATPAAESVRFTLDTEHPAAFQLFYAAAGPGDPCAGARGFGTLFGEPVRGAAIEVCIPAGQRVLVRVASRGPSLPCGSPSGPAYRLTLATSACNLVACCSLSGSCSAQSGPDCVAGGGISLGEGSTCASASCCPGFAVCFGTNASENTLPFSGGRVGAADVCINAANAATFTDTFNGGCENTATVFCNATTGQIICGTLSAYRQTVDSDWYQVTTIGANSYLGFRLRGQADMDISIYRKPSGVICPAAFADLAPNLLLSARYNGCSLEPMIIGDCLPAATYYVRVAGSAANVYGIPCAGGSGGASYRLEVLQGTCAGEPILCDGASENEPQCHLGGVNAGCDAGPGTSPSFTPLACGALVCGTADLVLGGRDTDWYEIVHPGGSLAIEYVGTFHAEISVRRPGVTGCADATVIESRSFVLPGEFPALTIPALPAGTYWIVVAPDPRGSSRVCCTTTPNYRLRAVCTPPCPCFFDLVANDCAVNTSDLVEFLDQFGRSCFSLPIHRRCADVNHDDVVNTVDLIRLLGQFGKRGNPATGLCE